MPTILPLSLLILLTLCVFHPVEAQQPTKIPKIGYLRISPETRDAATSREFERSLRDLGYIEGKNIVIEWRSGEGSRERASAFAKELLHLKVDLIVTGGAGATRILKEATDTTPIVMANDADPVGMGFVASLARPGGNITGLSILAPELGGKRLELLRETVPGLSRVAAFGTSSASSPPRILKEVESAANSLGVKLQYLDVLGAKDIDPAFRAAIQGRADAVLMMLSGPIMNAYHKQLIDGSTKRRLPAVYDNGRFVERGGLISYNASIPDLYRRAAIYVDKILKGAKPADLPVEQPRKFELVVNLKTAKQIGLMIPPNLLARADRVIR